MWSTARTAAPRPRASSDQPEGVALAADVIYVGDGVGVTAYDRVSLAPLWSAVVADEGNGLVVEAVEGGVLVRAGDGSLVVLR